MSRHVLRTGLPRPLRPKLDRAQPDVPHQRPARIDHPPIRGDPPHHRRATRVNARLGDHCAVRRVPLHQAEIHRDLGERSLAEILELVRVSFRIPSTAESASASRPKIPSAPCTKTCRRANRFAGSTFSSTPCNARIAKKTKKHARQEATACAPACSAYDESSRHAPPNSMGAIRLGRRFEGHAPEGSAVGRLLHNPDLLILDEPLSGLDVNTALVLRELVAGPGRPRLGVVARGVSRRSAVGRSRLWPAAAIVN